MININIQTLITFIAVNLDDAYEALKSNKIRAIGLDVLPKEPADIKHPLVKAWLNEEWANGVHSISIQTEF